MQDPGRKFCMMVHSVTLSADSDGGEVIETAIHFTFTFNHLPLFYTYLAVIMIVVEVMIMIIIPFRTLVQILVLTILIKNTYYSTIMTFFSNLPADISSLK